VTSDQQNVRDLTNVLPTTCEIINSEASFLDEVNELSYCETCGAQLIPGASFCSDCGSKVRQFHVRPSPQTRKQGILIGTFLVALIAFFGGIGTWSYLGAISPSQNLIPSTTHNPASSAILYTSATTFRPTISARGNCDPSYPTVCIPPPPPDLDCKDIPYRNFVVLPPDPHHFDGDGDGIGCET